MQDSLLDSVVELCQRAGEAILQVYHAEQPLEVDIKADDSPVTQADLAAHRILAPGLEQLLPDVPVLSEEGEIADFSTRQQWQRYWIIDPLDGTKEFIGRNGEFTVNVALIEQGVATLGVVHVPVSGVTYTGQQTADHSSGVAQKRSEGSTRDIQVRRLPAPSSVSAPIKVVASRNHNPPPVEALLHDLEQRLGPVVTTSMGSSLKLCLVAEGVADFYPRLAPTCEWDTAAAQAVVEAAGGAVLSDSLEPLRYNTKESLLNPHFHVIGDTSQPWREWLSQP